MNIEKAFDLLIGATITLLLILGGNQLMGAFVVGFAFIGAFRVIEDIVNYFVGKYCDEERGN